MRDAHDFLPLPHLNVERAASSDGGGTGVVVGGKAPRRTSEAHEDAERLRRVDAEGAARPVGIWQWRRQRRTLRWRHRLLLLLLLLLHQPLRLRLAAVTAVVSSRAEARDVPGTIEEAVSGGSECQRRRSDTCNDATAAAAAAAAASVDGAHGSRTATRDGADVHREG